MNTLKPGMLLFFSYTCYWIVEVHDKTIVVRKENDYQRASGLSVVETFIKAEVEAGLAVKSIKILSPKKKINLFVYGTLKRGHPNHELLRDARFVGIDSVSGELYVSRTRSMPFLFPGEEKIKGEVYEMTEVKLLPISVMETGAGYTEQEVTTHSGKKVITYYHSTKTYYQKSDLMKINIF